jgi:hypothetical protein
MTKEELKFYDRSVERIHRGKRSKATNFFIIAKAINDIQNNSKLDAFDRFDILKRICNVVKIDNNCLKPLKNQIVVLKTYSNWDCEQTKYNLDMSIHTFDRELIKLQKMKWLKMDKQARFGFFNKRSKLINNTIYIY